MRNTFPVPSVAAEPNTSSTNWATGVEKYESAYKPLQRRCQYVDHRRQKNILHGDMERAERHLMRRLRVGQTRVAEGILFGTYNRVYRQPTEGDYGEGVYCRKQAARRYALHVHSFRRLSTAVDVVRKQIASHLQRPSRFCRVYK